MQCATSPHAAEGFFIHNVIGLPDRMVGQLFRALPAGVIEGLFGEKGTHHRRHGPRWRLFG